MLPRLLDITEEEIEEGEMLANRPRETRTGFWKAVLILAAGVILLGLILCGCYCRRCMGMESPGASGVIPIHQESD